MKWEYWPDGPTNYGNHWEGNTGSILLAGCHIFKVEPDWNNNKSQKKLAEQVVRVLNRELPGGKPRSRKARSKVKITYDGRAR